MPLNPGDFIGRDVNTATAAAQGQGFGVRITRIDGEHFAVTMDWMINRLNFEIDQGLVSAVTRG